MIPQALVSDKEDELIGGLKNALSRGEPLNVASATFLNAGYSPQLVNMAVQRLTGAGMTPIEFNAQTPAMQVPTQNQNINIPANNLNLYAQRTPPQINTSQQTTPRPPQVQVYTRSRVPYWLIILLLFLSLGIIIAAGIFGLYWDKIF